MWRLEQVVRPRRECGCWQADIGMHRPVEVAKLVAVAVTGRPQRQTVSEIAQRASLDVVNHKRPRHAACPTSPMPPAWPAERRSRASGPTHRLAERRHASERPNASAVVVDTATGVAQRLNLGWCR